MHVHYRFAALVMNFETQLKKEPRMSQRGHSGLGYFRIHYTHGISRSQRTVLIIITCS